MTGGAVRFAKLARPCIFGAALAAVCCGVQGAELLPEDRGAAGLWRALLRLRTTASVLYVTAHPDDEDAGVLCLLARGEGARTMLLSLTRGEGGANLISAHFFDELGLLRTLELLRASAAYGVELFFTRAADYGYSKSVAEALDKWGGEAEILRDVVRVVRAERPDLIVARFRGDARDGHGHHTLAGVLARRAYEAAGDPSRFPEQLAEGMRPWRPRKLYHGSVRPDAWPEDRGVATVTVDPGVSDPLLGRSYHEIGREGYSFHRSQGMMAAPSAGGPRPARYRLVDALGREKLPEQEASFFDGIDTSISGLAALAGPEPPRALVEALEEVEAYIEEAIAVFDAREPQKTVPPLARGYASLFGHYDRSSKSLLDALGAEVLDELRPRLERKLRDFEAALELALGVSVDVRVRSLQPRGGPRGGSAGRFENAVPGQALTAQVTVTNRGRVPFEVRKTGITGVVDATLDGASEWKALAAGASLAADVAVVVPADALPTRPHWTRASLHEAFYTSPSGRVEVQPQPLPLPPLLGIVWVRVPTADLGLHDVDFPISEPLCVPVDEPQRGVRMLPLLIVPPVSVRFASRHGVVAASRGEYRLAAIVRSDVKGPALGAVRLKLPAGWTSQPTEHPFRFENESEERRFDFVLGLPLETGAAAAEIEASVLYESREYTEGYVLVSAPDVGRFHHYRPARHTVHKVDVDLPADLRVGYVMGSGDDVPRALELLGVHAEMLGAAELAAKDLSAFDAVVVGVRAYAVRPDLKAANRRLMDYVEKGGVLVVQYQTPEFDAGFGPYPYAMGSSPEEVSEEEAAVTILEPDHVLLRAPNAITALDFRGWVEERGAKFWTTWDPRYTALLECRDREQEPQRGGLCYARHGSGAYVYCAYALYRQLPQGVPGAFRLLANLAAHRRVLAPSPPIRQR